MDATDSPPRLTHNQALGAYGELLAARYLTSQGMVLLDHNWRCPQGEIDLVLRERRTLVICEVKTRTSNDYGTPHEAIDEAKVDRLRRLAASWLRVHAARPDDIRLDLVAVIRPRSGATEIDHVRGLM
jgi:putative endonuclease